MPNLPESEAEPSSLIIECSTEPFLISGAPPQYWRKLRKTLTPALPEFRPNERAKIRGEPVALNRVRGGLLLSLAAEDCCWCLAARRFPWVRKMMDEALEAKEKEGKEKEAESNSTPDPLPEEGSASSPSFSLDALD